MPEASAKERLSRDQAQEYTRRIHEAWEFARGNMEQAQNRYIKNANRHRREVDFDVKDYVWVSTKSWRTKRPSRKLDYQMAGKYKILEKIGHSFKLELPPGINIHPVIHASKLRKARNDPLPGQEQEESLPMEVDGELEWEVEKILGVRTVRKQLRYTVKWVGTDDDLDKYLSEDLVHSLIALREFHKKNPRRPSPLRNLDYWLECTERDEEPEKRDNDNIA